MGAKKIYTCNICREDIDTPENSFGLYFKNMTQFTLGGYGCTEGIHICYRCAVQLKDQLNDPEITKLFNQGGQQ